VHLLALIEQWIVERLDVLVESKFSNFFFENRLAIVSQICPIVASLKKLGYVR
jgi:hypothetical protein